MDISLWQHQKDAITRARELSHFGLFFEMGTGKTCTTIQILRHVYNGNKRMLRTLILCPMIVVDNWKREFKTFSKVPQEKIVCLTGSGASRVKAFDKAVAAGATIFVTNYEGLQMKDLYSRIAEWGPEVLVCDESHRLKNPKGLRTKLTTGLADIARYRYILTGTPILNTPMDIFSQYRILDRGETFGNNFFVFRAMYFFDKNSGMPKQSYFPNWQPRPDTNQRLNDLVYRRAMRVMKKDCMDLPPLIRQEVTVELSPEQRRMYQEMKKHFITYLNDKACVAQLAITKALRLQQLVSGYAKTDEGEEVRLADNPRLDALGELLEDLTPNHKVIVWAVFKENYRQIAALCEKLGIQYTELHGEQNHKEKVESVDRFRRDPGIRVIIANQAAGGIGINLVEASYSVFYSRNFSLEQDLQAESRNYRGGSEVHEKITRIDLVARETIDELILAALSKKQDLAEEILKWKDQL